MLRVDVTKQLGDFSLEASFESQGRVTGLFGASGAGKSSLINMIAGLLRPDRGVIALDDEMLDDTAAGVHVPPHRRRIGYVFQDARLFPHLDVRQNLDYGRRMNKPRDGSRAAEARHRPARYRSICSTAVPASFPAASASASRSAARCCRSRACCCWTSRWDRSTRAARSRSCPTWCGCATKAFRWSMSATTPPNCVSSRRRS